MALRGSRVEIDLAELEKLSSLQCTDEEIAAWFGVSTRTIERRRLEPDFGEVMQRGKAKGRISVRRMQMKLLEQGNATMGVWLGKALLGQREEVINDIRKIRSWSDLRLDELQALQSELRTTRETLAADIKSGTDSETPELILDIQAARSMPPNENASAADGSSDRGYSPEDDGRAEA